MSAVAKRTVVNLAGGSSATQRFKLDVTGMGKADIQRMIIGIVADETQRQIAAGNPPSITEVDGSKSKPVSQAQKKVIVLFGVQLQVETLRVVEGILMEAISVSTEAITGQLRNPANWEWRHIRAGQQVPLARTGTISFGPRDFLVLRPTSRIYYASAANKRVAAGARALAYYATEKAKARRSTAKRNQNLGFMAMTARACRQVQDLVPFSVTVGMTKDYAVPGELRQHGTAYLLIAPRRRRGFRR